MDSEALELLKERVLRHPDNQEILRFLRIAGDTGERLGPWPHAGSGFDEGGRILFDLFGKQLPNDVKFTLGIRNLMINPETGLVFAAHFGRCTFLVRCGRARLEGYNQEGLRHGETLDGFVDARSLGPDWTLLNWFCEDEQEFLEWAYSFSMSHDAGGSGEAGPRG
jgi:hypothetical protein